MWIPKDPNVFFIRAGSAVLYNQPMLFISGEEKKKWNLLPRNLKSMRDLSIYPKIDALFNLDTSKSKKTLLDELFTC